MGHCVTTIDKSQKKSKIIMPLNTWYVLNIQKMGILILSIHVKNIDDLYRDFHKS